jgi:hypothetical protein
MAIESVSPVHSQGTNVAIHTVDRTALTVNQALIVASIVVAFVAGGLAGAAIVLLVGLSLGAGAAWPGNGPFQVLYHRVLKRAGVVRPALRREDPTPHRFAQAMGAAVLVVAGALLLGGFTVVGWALAWVVVGLALVNLLFGFCAGCFIFLQIERVWPAGR